MKCQFDTQIVCQSDKARHKRDFFMLWPSLNRVFFTRIVYITIEEPFFIGW